MIMGQVTIKYGTNEHIWQEGDSLNPVTSSGMLSMTRADSTVVNLRQFDSQQEAEDARDEALEQIGYGLGNGDVIVTIDDL